MQIEISEIQKKYMQNMQHMLTAKISRRNNFSVI